MSQIVINDDCLQAMPKLWDRYFDVVCTSPPYNLGIKYDHYKDDIPRKEYFDWMDSVCKAIKGSLKDDGSFFLNVGFCGTDPWIANDVANIARKHFVLQNQIAWIKSWHSDGKTTGHCKPVRSERFLNNNFEYIYHFTKHGKVKIDRLALGIPYTDKNNIERWEREGDLRCGGNVWHIPYETIIREPITGLMANENLVADWITVTEAAEKAGVNKAIISMAVGDGVLLGNGLIQKERRISAADLARWIEERAKPKNLDHPAIFPPKLVENCIKLHGLKPDMKFLDPFLGLGNSLIACKRLGVEGVGIEIDPGYAERSKKRVEASLYNGTSEGNTDAETVL